MDIPRKKMTEDLKENNRFMEISKSDPELYDFLDSNLGKESPNNFSPGFSKNIIRKVEAKQQRRFNLKIYSILSFLVLISLPFFVIFFSTGIVSLIFSVFLKYKSVFSFLIIAVVLIQFGELISSRKDIR